jgi:hypothetical protein
LFVFGRPLTLVLYDLRAARRVHPATIAGVAYCSAARSPPWRSR